jgi:hypothetical protein
MAARVDLLLQEIGQARIRRTEVRPICKRRAISALLTPARYSFRALSAWEPGGYGSAQSLAVLPGVGQTGAHTFSQNLPLELREYSQ